MANVGSLVVNLLGNTQQFRAEFGAVPNILRGVTSSILQVVGVTGGLATLGQGIKLAADAEQAAVSFEVMTGSAKKARDILAGLRAYADKSPYSLAGGTEAVRLLLNLGIAAEETLPTLRMLGDIAGGDENKLMSLALAFGQSASAGRLMGQDLNQMINAGFNPLQEIAKRTGESMTQLKARMEAGGISTAEVTQAFKDATSEGGRFFGMTERQSGTVTGLYSTLRDTIDGTLRDIGQQLIETFDLRSILTSSIASLQEWSDWIRRSGNDVIVVGGILVGFVSGLTLVRTALFAAAQAQVLLTALSGPKGWAMLAAGILGAVVAAEQLNLMFDATTSKLMQVSTAATGAAAAVQSIGTGGGASSLQEELDNLEKIRTELSKGDLTANYRKGLEAREATSIGKINALTAVETGAKSAERPVDQLLQKIETLERAAASMGRQQFELLGGPDKLEALQEQVGKLSGATEKIQELRDQINGVTQADKDRRKLNEAGASNEQMREIILLQEEAARVKQLTEARDKLLAKTVTPDETFQKQIEELHALKNEGLIDTETFQRGLDLAATDLAKSENNLAKDSERQNAQASRRDQPLDALLAASKESQQAILRGMQKGDSSNPNQKLETLSERIAKAQERAATLLDNIASREPEQTIVMDYP